MHQESLALQEFICTSSPSGFEQSVPRTERNHLSSLGDPASSISSSKMARGASVDWIKYEIIYLIEQIGKTPVPTAELLATYPNLAVRDAAIAVLRAAVVSKRL